MLYSVDLNQCIPRQRLKGDTDIETGLNRK